MAYELCFRDVTKKNDVEVPDSDHIWTGSTFYDLTQIQQKLETRN